MKYASCLVSFSTAVFLALTVQAATIEVTTPIDEFNNGGDNGDGCSLREALRAANRNATFGGCLAGQGLPVVDVIHLPSLAVPYDLSIPGAAEDRGETGDLDIRESVTLVGDDAATVVIDAHQIDRIFQVHGASTSVVTLRGMTIRGGCAGGLPNCNYGGGGIEVNAGAEFYLEDSIVENNRGIAGGGLHLFYLGGPLRAFITDSVFQNNTAAVFGGAMSCHNDANLDGVTLVGNVAGTPTYVLGRAGGLGVIGGTTTLLNSTIRDNMAYNNGGGIAVVGYSGTSNGTTITNYGTLIATNSTLSGNEAYANGGGLYIDGGYGGIGVGQYPQYPCASSCTASLNNVTIANNIADADGALPNPLTLRGRGGGIAINGTGNNVNGTAPAPGILNMRNTLVAGNSNPTTIASSSPDCFGTFVSQDFNLIGVITGCTASSMLDGDKIGTLGVPLDPLLGDLQDDNGNDPTATHPLFPGSPAIDGGDPGGCLDENNEVLTTDQRGAPRPRVGCDIGAFES